jgi:hypothetical protein
VFRRGQNEAQNLGFMQKFVVQGLGRRCDRDLSVPLGEASRDSRGTIPLKTPNLLLHHQFFHPETINSLSATASRLAAPAVATTRHERIPILLSIFFCMFAYADT